LKSFPHARPADPAAYIVNLAATLTGFPAVVVDYVTGPGTGIQAEPGRTYLPTPGEVAKACRERMAHLRALHDAQEAPKRAEERKAARKAEEEARKARPSLDDLKAKYGPNYGLKTTDDVENEERREKRIKQETVDRHNAIAREWDREGKAPPMLGGVPVSKELAGLIRQQTGRPFDGTTPTDEENAA
jgi:hypothetical protein